jgi:hypothetical protein
MPAPGIPRLDPLRAAPGEVTARELAAALARGGNEPLPAIARETGRLRMRRGERAHRALETLPLEPPAAFDLEAWLVEAGLEEPDRSTVAAFVESEVWPRLGAAAPVHREIPFRLSLPAPGGIVVGAIDCLWQDAEDAWWVWDYKLASDDGAEAGHEAQLSIYALAAAASLGVDEVRGALWYLESGRAREHRWDRAALAETAERLALAFPRVAATAAGEGDE